MCPWYLHLCGQLVGLCQALHSCLHKFLTTPPLCKLSPHPACLQYGFTGCNVVFCCGQWSRHKSHLQWCYWGCRVGSGIVVLLLAIIGRWLDCMPSSKPALQRIVCGPSRKSDKSKWLFLIQVEIPFFLLAECIIWRVVEEHDGLCCWISW
jgi:hypothetical protein